MKPIKLIIAVLLVCSLVTNFYYYFHTNTVQHDYYLDVSPKGYSLYDTNDNRYVGSWCWNENEQLDGVIEEDNQ